MSNISNKSKTGYLILLALFVAAAYFPVFFHLFSLKNDALVYFLPYRYQVSSAIQQGHFPWWSGSIYLGTPLYSDIQSGAWNPLVWLLSLFGKYNMSMLETELSIYLLAAAAGMYKLAGRFTTNSPIRLIVALSYACSGFMTDSGSFIPWMNAAAVLPFLFCFFIQLLEKPVIQSTIYFTVITFLLLTAGYPSFLVFTGYLLTGILAFLLYRYRKQWSTIRPVLLQLLLFSIFSLLLWSPVVYAWADFFPYYQRGGTIPLSFAQSNPYPPAGMISLLVPAGVIKDHDWLQTDPGMRNISIGLFAFVLLPLSFRTVLKDRLFRIIAFITLISLLISLGGATAIHGWCHEYLPLFNRFRHPGTFRLFVISGLLLLSISSFEQVFTTASKNVRLAKRIGWTAFLILLLITGTAFTRSGLAQGVFPAGGAGSLTKAGFADLMLIQGTLQLLFTGLFLLLLYKKKTKALAAIIIAQVIVAVWFALPFTFISKTAVKTIDQAISAITNQQASEGMTEVIRHSDRLHGPEAPALIIPAFYEIGPIVNHDIISPTVSTGYLQFLKDTTRSRLSNGMSWAYISTDTVLTESTPINAKQINPQEQVSLISKTQTIIRFKVHTSTSGYLHFFQQYHHRWQASVNGTPTGIRQVNHAFMAVPVSAGNSEIEIRFQPGLTQYSLNYIALFTLAGLLIVGFILSVRLKKQDKTTPEKEAVS